MRVDSKHINKTERIFWKMYFWMYLGRMRGSWLLSWNNWFHPKACCMNYQHWSLNLIQLNLYENYEFIFSIYESYNRDLGLITNPFSYY